MPLGSFILIQRHSEGMLVMPLDKPNLQPALFDIPELEDEGVSVDTARQQEKAAALALMSQLTGEADPPKWADRYLMLRGQGWSFRKAAYIAWKSMPRDKRDPKTQDELAQQVLGLTSDRVITTWREKNPMIDEAVSMLLTADLYAHRSAVFEALKDSAANSDYKHHPDRKLFLEMTGDYVPISQLRAMLMSGKLKTNKTLEDMSESELIALSQGDLTVLGNSEDNDGGDE